MKILQLISSTGFYGAEKVVLGLAQGLKENGYGVAVAGLFTAGSSDRTLLEKAHVSAIRTQDFFCRRRFDVSTVRALRHWVRDSGVDIIHSHGYKSDFYALLARPSKTTGLVATCHNWLGISIKMKSYRWLDTMLIKNFDRVVVVSGPLRSETVAAGVSAGKIDMVHNGVALRAAPLRTEAVALRSELGIGPDDRVVAAIGRLSPEKGYACLIDAAPAVLSAAPDTWFLIAGDGPDRQELSSAIAAKGLSRRVLLLGKRDDVDVILAASTVFVMPSLREGMPVALLEAMAMGKPVVASRVGEIPRMVAEGIEGILVAPNDREALSSALSEMLNHPRQAELMGTSARNRAREEFSVEKMTRSYLKIYEEVYRIKRYYGAS